MSSAADIEDLSFTELITLRPLGDDQFEAPTARYPWGPRLYGGQVVAQALRAAQLTVAADRLAHSLHAYFLRAGSPDEPVVLRVQRLRDGRSFSARQIAAVQSSGVILTMTSSFHRVEPEADIQLARIPENLPRPDDGLDDYSWGGLIERKATTSGRGRAGFWIRLNERAEALVDPQVRQCALAFVTDAAPSRAARSPHPEFNGRIGPNDQFSSASLDHAVWFHRPTDPTVWHWYDMVSHGMFGGRGTVVGDGISVDGIHAATVTQQVLLRRLAD